MSKALIKESSYTDFSRDFFSKVLAQRVPAAGTIELTHRCSLNCVQCYNNRPIADVAARASELSCEEHHRIVDEVAEEGCLHLLYTGGEIFARNDILDIYTYAKSKGILVTLFTNATFVTDSIAEHLTAHRPFAVEATMYGRTAETYERVTRVPGSYDRFMRGIRLLHERRLPLKLKTVLTRANKHEFWDMKRFAEEEIGVRFSFDGLLNARTDCSHSPLAARLSPEEIVELDLRDSKRVSELRRLVAMHSPPRPKEQQELLYCCGGGVSSWTIHPDGKLNLCILAQEQTFDLRKGSFREGWQVFLKKVREQKCTRQTKCTECRIRSLCGMCPANGVLERGDAETPVDFFCHVAHLRAAALNVAVPEHGDCEYCKDGAKYDLLLQNLSGLHEPLAHSAARIC